MSVLPTVSVVVNTYNRAASLQLTLDSLRQLDYPNFEVVVVNGPSTDHTEAVIDRYRGRIKVAHCPEANLSWSRNIGIGLSAGHIVAFIDDDAYPDPEWLDCLVLAYRDGEVAGAGGPVYDHTGARFQTRYLISDRTGGTTSTFDVNPTRWVNVPGAPSFGRLIGTNSSFRRDRLLEIGGFDEEFNYYLDDTDVCVRLVDAGYVISQLDDGFVYHKFLPSDIRDENRVTRDSYGIVRNTCYFALKNTRAGSSFLAVCVSLTAFVEAQRGYYAGNIERGLLLPEDLEKFEADVPAAFASAWQRFLEGDPKTRSQDWFDDIQQPFLPFATLRPRSDKRHICLVSQDYPPLPLGGIGRLVHTLAKELAAAGHVVRVLTKGEGHDRVDLEDGVWVHRIVATSHPAPELLAVPQHIWDHAASVLDELHRIDRHRPIDVTQVPNWDAEGLAVLLEGTLCCVVGLYTPMRTVQRIDPRLRNDPLAGAIAQCERVCYQRADGLLADSWSVVTEIETEYGIQLATEHLEVCHLGLADRAAISTRRERPPGEILIGFVGRLEKRKGIDTLLACLPELLAELPDVSVVIAGQDDIPGEDGRPYRAVFEASPEGKQWAARVHFLGPVTDSELDEFYASCDILAVPSRYESFGLVLLETMMFAKPVVSCDVGGIREIVRDGDSGLLVPPGDSGALARALAQLCRSEPLRRGMGLRGRAIYEEQFTVGTMVERIGRFYDRLRANSC